jgi:hypothetical protein
MVKAIGIIYASASPKPSRTITVLLRALFLIALWSISFSIHQFLTHVTTIMPRTATVQLHYTVSLARTANKPWHSVECVHGMPSSKFTNSVSRRPREPSGHCQTRALWYHPLTTHLVYVPWRIVLREVSILVVVFFSWFWVRHGWFHRLDLVSALVKYCAGMAQFYSTIITGERRTNGSFIAMGFFRLAILSY